jgi:ssDNA thymidine ADP-ribosyltransferase, DarT
VRSRFVYHFTHFDNVRAICDSGFIRCDVAAREGLTRTEVGDPEIKESRRRRRIPVGPGGQVGDYVPFYFATRSPMMYRIACDHRDSIAGRYPQGDRPLIYLVTTVGAVVDAALAWVATDGNAATATTEFTADLRRLDAMVDWPLMRAERWNNTAEDPDRQRRRMAEFLVHDRLPTSLIHWIGTSGEDVESHLRMQLGDHPLAGRIIVRPHWYYGYERR